MVLGETTFSDDLFFKGVRCGYLILLFNLSSFLVVNCCYLLYV